MARNQTSKPSKVDKDEEEQIHVKEEVIEEEEEKEKSLLVRSIPQPSRLVEEGSIRSSVRETLTLSSPLSLQGNERDSSDCRRSFLNPLTGAVPSPANSAGGPEATSVPVFMISGESTAEACRRFLSESEATPVPVFTISGESTAEACRSFLSGFQGQFGMSHQEALASVTAHAQMKLQAAHPSLPSGLPLNSPIPSALSAFTPIPQPQKPQQLLDDSFSTPEAEQHPPFDQKPHSTHVAKAPFGDCYNWRKYGQKQVKGCTHINCQVRKSVMRCYSGNVIEVVYKGQHNHDPPQKIRYTRESRVLSGASIGESDTANHPGEEINGSKSPTPKTQLYSGLATHEQQFNSSSGCDVGAGIKVEYDDVPEPKRRITYSTPPLKTTRDAKVVVQTGSDLGILDDGYKWRKYGQKIVKGNPNPRSYYKCTYDRCQVRKHVERASDDAKALVITYEGKHNHERVASKNSYGSYGPALLIAAAAALSAGGQLTTSNDLPVEESPVQFLSDRKDEVSEKALELGGEKALESAQTLLSIGLNLNSSEAERGAKNANVIERPFFNGNNAVVSV
nr:WRKY18 [Phoebe bournei]